MGKEEVRHLFQIKSKNIQTITKNEFLCNRMCPEGVKLRNDLSIAAALVGCAFIGFYFLS